MRSRTLTIGLVVAITTSNALAQSEVPALVFRDHKTEVTAIAFSPDGKRLVSTALKEDHIWDSATGKSIGKLTGIRGHAVAFRPDGKRIAWTGFKRMAVFKTADLQEIWKFDATPEFYLPPYISALAWNPDGRLLATSAQSSKVGGRHGLKGGIVQIFNAETGRELHRIDNLSHHSGTIAFSPDGRFLAFGTDGAGGELPEPGELHILETKKWERVHLLRTKEEIIPGKNRCSATGIAWSPDGKSIAFASSDWTVRIWNVSTGMLRLTLNGHKARVRRVAWSPDGKQIASTGVDRTVILWNPETGESTRTLPCDMRRINAVVYSPDGKRLAVGGGDFLKSGEVRIWNVTLHVTR